MIDKRGVLYPHKLPTFLRLPAPLELQEFIGWFWITKWDLPHGQISRQTILPFPASNLVVEPNTITLSGPATGVLHRDLKDRGWAVGALLRPAAIPSICENPKAIQDRVIVFEAPALHRKICNAMNCKTEKQWWTRAVNTYVEWAKNNLKPPTENGLIVNAIEEYISCNRTIVRVSQLAEHFHLSARQIQRLTQNYVGLAPLTMIRRYRLQEAAKRLREDASLTISQVAADLGYSDHAHLTADFRCTLGFTPNAYRQNHVE